tara:strand:- start:289004 stop:289192 length:189 start_codon:yes stop_codon:yes gene_type:complete
VISLKTNDCSKITKVPSEEGIQGCVKLVKGIFKITTSPSFPLLQQEREAPFLKSAGKSSNPS